MKFIIKIKIYVNKKEHPIDIHSLDSCEYIWEAGIGYTHSQPAQPQQDSNRVEVLKLILTTFSETMYLPPTCKHPTCFYIC